MYLLSSVLFRLFAFLNVALCPLNLSLNVFFVRPIYIYVSLLSLVVTVA